MLLNELSRYISYSALGWFVDVYLGYGGKNYYL